MGFRRRHGDLLESSGRLQRLPAGSADGAAESHRRGGQKSTAQLREAACRREIELNRRIAPDVYEGVGELRGSGGETLEHMVVMRRGAIVDGHGDLLADDIFCLPDGPRILDCLEFADALRHLDRIDDLACLVMDLERLGAQRAGCILRDHYLELSGDSVPASLLDHYIAYRAFMRAKVTCLRVESTGSGRAEPRPCFYLALLHLAGSRVSLTLVGGPPGTGKSTLATALADRIGAVVLSNDRVRKELAGLPPETAQRAAFGHGIYADSWTDRTYQELLRRAGRLLAMGESVVLDASWAEVRRRLTARTLAQESSSDLSEIRCDAPVDVAESRIRDRMGGPSDADVEVAREMRARFEPWPEAAGVRTTQPLTAEVTTVLHFVRPPVQR